MKKILLTSLCILVLGACGSNATSSSNHESSSLITSSDTVAPMLYNVKDKKYELNSNVTKEVLLNGIYYIDNVDGKSYDVSLTILDFYKETEVINLDTSVHGKYILKYSCQDKSGNKQEKSANLEIGEPNKYLTHNGDFKEYFGIGYTYDYNQVQKDYKLVFEEEFEEDGRLDPNEWVYEKGNGQGGWGNNEEQSYTTNQKNCYISKGRLVIRAYKEKVGQFNYSSARVHTINAATWRYGKFEIRAKLPMGGGSWPAIWMMPESSVYGTWPNSGEIDIMETTWNNHRGRILGTTHTLNGSGGRAVGGSTYIGDSIYDEYKTYSIEWLPDKIIWAVDGNEYFTYDPSKISSRPTYVQWPYDQKFFLILNLAIGGNMAGSVASDLFDQYDVSMYVDSIRVYQSEIIDKLSPSFN